MKNKKAKFSKKINRGVNGKSNYIRLKLTFTSRVIAGWAITLVGLIKLWQTEDPAAWWPILMGGTGLMILSRGVDHFMKNQAEELEDEHVEDMAIIKQESPYQHANINDGFDELSKDKNDIVKRHLAYQKKLNA